MGVSILEKIRVILFIFSVAALAVMAVFFANKNHIIGLTESGMSLADVTNKDTAVFKQSDSGTSDENQKDITAFRQFDSDVPNVSEGMLYPEFWIKNTSGADNLIATSEKIEAYNKANIKKHVSVADLENYEESLTRAELIKKINSLSKVPSSVMYNADGKKVGSDYYKGLTDNLNLEGLQDTNKVRYGISIRRTEMRTFPTHDRLYSSSSNHNIDRLMETAVYPIEPMVILSASKDGQWYFAQIYNYLAWIPAKDVALTDDKNELFSYVDREPFLVVTGDKIYSNYNPDNQNLSEIRFDMGTRLPLAAKDEVKHVFYGQNPAGNFVIKVPAADKSGNLVFDYALISRSADVSLGYLPYTKSNIIKEAFKMEGERYGWGGTFNGRDCSSFIMDIFRTMGLKLPRNSDDQAQAVGNYYEMPSGMTLKERKLIFDKMEPGTGLYMNGHTMLYLGKYNGEYYIIHDFSGYYVQNKNGGNSYYSDWEVTVTPLSILLSSGKTYMEGLYGAREFVPGK